MAEPNLPSRVVSNVVNAHYGWYIVAMGTTLQLTTNFVSQAFAILVVVMRDNFGWSLTASNRPGLLATQHHRRASRPTPELWAAATAPSG